MTIQTTPIQTQTGSKRQTLALAIGAAVLVFLLWQLTDQSAILYPLRLLVTFVHESGHGISAIATGGQFIHFVVYPNGSGVATTAGGSALVVPQMGYLGAALFGAALLYAANRIRPVKVVAAALGMFFIACALLYTGAGATAVIGAAIAVIAWLLANRFDRWSRWLRIVALLGAGITLLLVWSNVALVVGLIAGSALLTLAAFGSPAVVIFVLNAIAFVTGLNAINDLRVLIGNESISMGGTPNDAMAMAIYTHTPVAIWIFAWIGLALLMMGAALYFSFLRQGRD